MTRKELHGHATECGYSYMRRPLSLYSNIGNVLVCQTDHIRDENAARMV